MCASSSGATASRSKWPARRRTRRAWRPSRRAASTSSTGAKIRFGRRRRALARRLRVGARVLFRRVGPDAPRGGAASRRGAAGAPGRAAAAAAVALGPRGAGARARRDALPLRRLPPARRRDFSSSPRRGVALCATILGREPPGVDRDPPSLRVGKYAPVETLALLFVGSFAASATALPLRRALGDAAFRSLAAGALLRVAAAICHVAAGAGHAAAHALTLTGAASCPRTQVRSRRLRRARRAAGAAAAGMLTFTALLSRYRGRGLARDPSSDFQRPEARRRHPLERRERRLVRPELRGGVAALLGLGDARARP